MKICVAQTKPIKGNIPKNIENHKKLINLAVANGADMIVFPELSLTGYEPTLAKALATTKEDVQFNDFQDISDKHQIIIGVGMPIHSNQNINIAMILFHPNKPRQMYSKKYLHSSEEPFFVSGENTIGLLCENYNIALAICYELSVPEHSENAFKMGAEIYIASVVEDTIDKAIVKLTNTSKKYGMTVLMANCVGQSGEYLCDGKSSIWNSKGELLGQLNTTDEGILIMDTNTQKLVAKSYYSMALIH